MRRPAWAPQSLAGTISSALHLAASHAAVTSVLVLLVAAAFAAPNFYNQFNLRSVAEQAAILGTVTTGQALVLLVRGFDLSVGAVAGVMALSLVMIGGPPGGSLATGIVVGFAVAILVGLANSWLVVNRRVPPFVATLGMLIAVEGARFTATDGQASGSIPSFVTTVGRGDVGPIPVPVFLWVGLTLIVAFLLHRTTYGRGVLATGSNPEAARMAGISIGWITCSAYVVCALSAALAGMMLTGNIGYVDQSLGSGQNLNINSIAAAVIGGVAFTGGEGNVLEPMAGALLLVMLANLIVVLGFPVQLQLVAQGAVLIGAVTLKGFEARLRSRPV